MTAKCPYRTCFVPKCRNTTITSNKRFMCVPQARPRRQKWFEAVGREMIDSKSVFFCCEDHFNFEEDMENYVRYKLMNPKPTRIHMKPDVVPHIFYHQSNRKDKQRAQPTLSKTNQPHNPSNFVSMQKECDKNVYIVVNKSAVIQGLLVFKKDLTAPEENRTGLNEVEQPVENSMCENVGDRKGNAGKHIEIKEENGGVIMSTIKIESLELDQKIQVLGETKAVIKEEPNPYEQQYFGETNQEIEYIEVKEESREIDEVQEWKPHIKSEADEDLETNFMISNKEIRKIMEGQKLQIKSEVEICEEEEPSINSSYNVHTTDVLEHDVQCESSRERDTLGEDYESCSAMEDKKCVEDVDIRHVCCMCNIEFSSAEDQKYHKRLHLKAEVLQHEKRLLLCKFCNKQFTRKYSLKCHEANHTESLPLSCHQCGKSFMRKQKLKEHQRVHTDECPFACKFCDRRFKQKRSLSYHEKTHQNEGLTQIHFNIGGGSNFVSEGVNLQHICCVCNFQFSNATELKYHKRLHPSEEVLLREKHLLVCKFCNKQFSRKYTLKCHEATHTQGRPFPCQHCNKSFAVKWHLKEHIRIHTDERPFSCQYCGKRFRNKHGLRYHEGTHMRRLLAA